MGRRKRTFKALAVWMLVTKGNLPEKIMAGNKSGLDALFEQPRRHGDIDR